MFRIFNLLLSLSLLVGNVEATASLPHPSKARLFQNQALVSTPIGARGYSVPMNMGGKVVGAVIMGLLVPLSIAQRTVPPGNATPFYQNAQNSTLDELKTDFADPYFLPADTVVRIIYTYERRQNGWFFTQATITTESGVSWFIEFAEGRAVPLPKGSYVEGNLALAGGKLSKTGTLQLLQRARSAERSRIAGSPSQGWVSLSHLRAKAREMAEFASDRRYEITRTWKLTAAGWVLDHFSLSSESPDGIFLTEVSVELMNMRPVPPGKVESVFEGEATNTDTITIRDLVFLLENQRIAKVVLPKAPPPLIRSQRALTRGEITKPTESDMVSLRAGMKLASEFMPGFKAIQDQNFLLTFGFSYDTAASLAAAGRRRPADSFLQTTIKQRDFLRKNGVLMEDGYVDIKTGNRGAFEFSVVLRPESFQSLADTLVAELREIAHAVLISQRREDFKAGRYMPYSLQGEIDAVSLSIQTLERMVRDEEYQIAAPETVTLLLGPDGIEREKKRLDELKELLRLQKTASIRFQRMPFVALLLSSAGRLFGQQTLETATRISHGPFLDLVLLGMIYELVVGIGKLIYMMNDRRVARTPTPTSERIRLKPLGSILLRFLSIIGFTAQSSSSRPILQIPPTLVRAA